MSAQATVAGLLGVALLLSAGTVEAGPGDVYYIADQDTDDVQELYRQDARSGAVAKINPPLVEGRRVETFSIAPR